MSDQNKFKQKESWPLLLLGGGFLLAIIAFAAVYNAFMADDALLVQSYVQQLNITDENSNEALSVYAAPGSVANLKINVAKSIKGLWSSDGISLSITDSQGGAVLAFEEIEQEKNWSKAIEHTVLERNDPVQVDIQFQLSSKAEIGANLSGIVTGQITYPTKKTSEDQKEVTQGLVIPLKVIVISPENLAERVRDTAKKTIWITSPISLLMIVFSIIYMRKNRKSK
jgi:hypothetical protein